jgi:transcriptional regulator with XRE-family HTH domain
MHRGIAIGMLRVRRGWRVQDLARAARVSTRTINRCEKGQRLREELLASILRALAVTPGELARLIDPYVQIETDSPLVGAEHARMALRLRLAFDHLQAVMAFWERVEAQRLVTEDSRHDATP